MAGDSVTRLAFARERESVPFDIDGELTDWRPANKYGDPEHGMATRYVGHWLAGDAGYVAEDLGRDLVGHEAVSALSIVTPDFDALGVACLVARGNGGIGPASYYGYEFGIELRTDAIGLYHGYQDSTGQYHYQEIGQTGRPPRGTAMVVSWCRERDELRAFVNGDLVGEVALAGAGPVMAVDGPVTVGCRATTSGYQRHCRGVLQYLELHAHAVTPEQERHRYARLWSAAPQWADIAESLLLPLPGRQYRDIRRATLGALFGAVASDIEIAEAGMSPMTAYGPALERWERAAGVRSPTFATVAERQAAVTAAVRAPSGFNVPAMRAYAAELLGVDVGQVAIIEGRNTFELPCAGDGPIPGPWRATGIGYAYSTPDGLHLEARVGDDLGFASGNRHGIQLAVAIPHHPGSTSNAFVARLDGLVGTLPTQWAGLVLRTRTELLWLGAFDTPSGRRLAWRRRTAGQLSPWTELATLVGTDVELAVEYDGDQWVARVGLSRFALGDALVDWIGVALGADGATSAALSCRVTSVHLQCGDAPAQWQWTAVCTDPAVWRDDHTALLQRRSRATASAHISRAPVMHCDDTRSQLGRTPLAMSTAAQHLPETIDDGYHQLGWKPSYIFSYQGRELREHISGVETIAANPSLMTETTGPDGRPALTYAANTFHYTADAGFLPFLGNGFIVAMVCKLDGTPGRVLSQWQPSQHAGFLLECAADRLQLTIGSPDETAQCHLQTADLPLDAWTVITIAIERTANGWRATLASPTVHATADVTGSDFTPAARLSINRWSSAMGTMQTCRWLGVFKAGQQPASDWPAFSQRIARIARAL